MTAIVGWFAPKERCAVSNKPLIFLVRAVSGRGCALFCKPLIFEESQVAAMPPHTPSVLRGAYWRAPRAPETAQYRARA